MSVDAEGEAMEIPKHAFDERTVKHRGPRAAAARSMWPAAQLGR